VKVGTKIGEIWPFDPSCYQPEFDLDGYTAKQRRWILASLPDQSGWVRKLPTTWPVEIYGHKNSGRPRMEEIEIVRRYASSWGVLSPKYKHAGSGWWRSRFKYAVDAGAIMLADPVEVDGLGAPYSTAMGALRTIEEFDEKKLRTVAELQADCFLSRMWSEEAFVQWADGMVRRLAQ
jgi:hypothetical protein